MGVRDPRQLVALKEVFLQKCFDIIEEGVESGAFRMKDVAGYLGISSQVASKLVNPTGFLVCEKTCPLSLSLI